MDVAGRWTSTVVLGDGTSALIRPITPEDAAGARRLPQPAVRREPLPALLLPEARAERRRAGALHDRRLRRSGGLRGRGTRRVRRLGELRTMEQPRRRRGGVHGGRPPSRQGHRHLVAGTPRRARSLERDRTLHRETLGDNRGMLAVFAKAGWPVHRRFESGVIDVDFSLEDTASFIDSVERREQRADSRAMARLLLATSIAVIGASDARGTIGNRCGVASRTIRAAASTRSIPTTPPSAASPPTPASPTSPTTSAWP